MSDLDHQNLNPTQSNLQPMPPTIVAAATIAPTTYLSYITGTGQLQNIIPPATGLHTLVLIFTNAAPGTFLTTGNILTAVVPTQNIPTFLLFDPALKKYYGWANNLT